MLKNMYQQKTKYWTMSKIVKKRKRLSTLGRRFGPHQKLTIAIPRPVTLEEADRLVRDQVRLHLASIHPSWCDEKLDSELARLEYNIQNEVFKMAKDDSLPKQVGVPRSRFYMG
jgi:hypothetical protein